MKASIDVVIAQLSMAILFVNRPSRKFLIPTIGYLLVTVTSWTASVLTTLSYTLQPPSIQIYPWPLNCSQVPKTLASLLFNPRFKISSSLLHTPHFSGKTIYFVGDSQMRTFANGNRTYPVPSPHLNPFDVNPHLTFPTFPTTRLAFLTWACTDDHHCKKFTMENFDEQFCNTEKLPPPSSLTVLVQNCGQWPASHVSKIIAFYSLPRTSPHLTSLLLRSF